MADNIEIRTSVPGDLSAIELLYRDAFPNEDLLPLVRDLIRESPVTFSLVGIVRSNLIGHVVFTTCDVTESCLKVALLGPLAVASAWQRQGFGSAMVLDGLHHLENEGFDRVYVLGDPAYYGRLGFCPESDVKPPYPVPAEWSGAWQSMRLGNAEVSCHGRLSVPRPWRQPALWAP